MSPVPALLQVIYQAEVDRRVRPAEMLAAVREALRRLGEGRAVQPPQTVVDLGGGADVISFHGLDFDAGLYGVKVSPYLPKPGGRTVVTAWTVLLDTRSGDPVAIVDAGGLTAHRTAAASAVAVQELLTGESVRAVVVGTGPLARAHVQYAVTTGRVSSVAVASRDPQRAAATAMRWRDEGLAGDVELVSAGALDEESRECGLMMLCTSAAAPLVDLAARPCGSLTTSISTNASGAHEVVPDSVAVADVFVDYAPAALSVAAEVGAARESGLWSDDQLCGDLPGVLAGTSSRPDGRRPVYFRSVGLGLEDVAAAALLVDWSRH